MKVRKSNVRSRKGRNLSRKRVRNRRVNSLIRLLIIVFSTIIISTILLKSVNTVSLAMGKDNDVDNSENINIIRDEENEVENQDKNEDSTTVEESIINNDIVYLPLEADENATDAREIQNRLTEWNYQREDGKKIAYLTFDDGPSEYVTDEILDVLKEKDVKATFFVLGSMIDQNDYAKEALKRIVKEGHAVGNHGYCHRYDILYPGNTVNVESFMDDMQKSENAMKEVLGNDFSTNVIRFPGGHGSWNTGDIDTVLEEQGYSYIDWNALNGDAEGQELSPDILLSRLQETVADLEGNNDVIVVLMHDTDKKQGTAQYLSSAIDYLINQGYEFKALK